MSNKEKLKNLDQLDFEFEFLSDEQYESETETGHYKVLIVDDDEDVHRVTKMVLENFEFEGKNLKLFHTYSHAETVDFLKEEKDIAVILLDVVMEEDDSGLKTIQFIRNELKDEFVRIILRTGQPGKAPEEKIIVDYDINDYKSKTELTVQKLYTSMYSSLRSFRDLRTIEQNKKGLEQVIKSTNDFLRYKSFEAFTEGILIQLSALLNLSGHSMYMVDEIKNGFVTAEEEQGQVIVAATGKFKDFIGKSIYNVLDEDAIDSLENIKGGENITISNGRCIGYNKTRDNIGSYVYMEGISHSSDIDKNLINIFLNNFSIIFENFRLNQDIIETQNEIIYILGEAVENKSEETANHVKRVAEISYLMAVKAGLSEEDAELIKSTSILHDIGKVGIPDNILKKPGLLTEEEFDVMKTHSEIGYTILKNSKRRLVKLAAEIALSHHERWDGKGYPNGLFEGEIPIHARIVSIADVFDALLHKRYYKSAWPIERTVDYFRKQTGKRFDPELVNILMENLSEFYGIIKSNPDSSHSGDFPHINEETD